MNHLPASLFVVGVLVIFAACSRARESNAEVDRIKAEAMAENPTDPLAATKAANEALELKALQTAQPTNPQEVAALVFLGYYAKNVLHIPSVCNENGVNIETFTTAFVETNKMPFEAAAAIVDPNFFIARARPSASKNARVELERFASVQKTDLRGACSFIKEHALEMASGAKFAIIMPKVYAQLIRP
jgi:hypothetical protein